MIKKYLLFSIFFGLLCSVNGQIVQDDFEGNGNISNWFGDNCIADTSFNNPVKTGINNSNTVLKYHDQGAQYANIRFDIPHNFNLSTNSTFTLKVYVPSTGLTGTQANQISLKLQDGTLPSPWSTQSEVIKPIVLNQWQTVSFDFANDPFINLNATSLPPTQRTDFNRIVIQLNGENNTDQVLGYIDDFYYFDTIQVATGNNFTQLVWADEFNGSGAIDTSKWFHQTQLPQGGSWFNGEIQHYTNRTVNTYQSNGSLHLVARREAFTDQGYTKQFTSARLNSKFTMTYGRVEVRAILPTGVGTWPAIWMLGKNINENGAYWDNQGFGTTSWPACGEIDIMEHWGNNQNFVQSAMHTPSSFGGTVNKGGQTIPTASSNFHLYALEWTPTKMIFSVDSVVHYTYQPAVRNASTWPFDLDQYILLNIAIQPGIAASFSQSTMEIDYVRVYQQGTVGINENQKENKLIVAPNPVRDELNILIEDSRATDAQIRIVDIQGREVISQSLPIQNGKIRVDNLDTLSPGLYLGSTLIGSKVNRFKFVKD